MTTLCQNCHLPDRLTGHMLPDICIGAQQEAMHHLLNQVADRGTCTGCGAAVYWVRHKNGKRVPYTEAGLNHFIDCPKADQFRKKVTT